MITKEKALSGEWVLIREGRWLSSRRNPTHEAEQWLERIPLENIQAVLLMGFGSGFHLQALVNKYPDKDVFCIEHHAETLQFIKTEPQYESLLKYVLSPPDIDFSGLIQWLNQRNCKVLQHPLVSMFDQDQFMQIAHRITGHTSIGLSEWVRARWGLALENQKNDLDLYSIKDLSGLLTSRPTEIPLKDRLLISALRELVI